MQHLDMLAVKMPELQPHLSHHWVGSGPNPVTVRNMGAPSPPQRPGPRTQDESRASMSPPRTCSDD